MANGCFEVTRIEASRPLMGGSFSFVAVMSTASGEEFRVEVDTEALLDFAAFQTAILKASGMVFRHLSCQERPVEIVNAHWQSEVNLMIRHVSPVVDPLNPPN